MKNYLLFALISLVLATNIACSKKPTLFSNFDMTGLVDDYGNLITKFYYTNIIYITNYVTNTDRTVETNVITNILKEYIQVPDPHENWHKYQIWVPYAAKSELGYNSYVVSYKDYDKLKELWLSQLKREGESDRKYFFIRSGKNMESTENFQKNGEYFLFDDSGDMYYKKLNLKVKELVGAIIVKARNGTSGQGKVSGQYTVGGLYRLAVDRNTYLAIADTNNDSEAFRMVLSPNYDYHISVSKGITSYSYDRKGDMQRQKEDLDVIVLNNGYSYNDNQELGFDSYLYYGGNDRSTEWNRHFFTNEKVYLNASSRPEYISGILDYTINYSDRTTAKNGQYQSPSFRDYNYSFVAGNPLIR